MSADDMKKFGDSIAGQGVDAREHAVDGLNGPYRRAFITKMYAMFAALALTGHPDANEAGYAVGGR